MIGQSRVILRVTVLCGLICCLVLVSRNNGNARRQETKPLSPPSLQAQIATVTADNRMGSPLVISAAGPVSDDLTNTDLVFNVTNVSTKKIRAYLVKQQVESAG
jgi:hypothetical protein